MSAQIREYISRTCGRLKKRKSIVVIGIVASSFAGTSIWACVILLQLYWIPRIMLPNEYPVPTVKELNEKLGTNESVDYMAISRYLDARLRAGMTVEEVEEVEEAEETEEEAEEASDDDDDLECPSCGAVVEAGDTACPICGYPLE